MCMSVKGRGLPQLTCLGPVCLQAVGLIYGALHLQVSARESVSCLHSDALGSVNRVDRKQLFWMSGLGGICFAERGDHVTSVLWQHVRSV